MKGMLPTMSERKQNIIERIEKLSDEQFELLLTLHSLQEQVSVQAVQAELPSFLQSSQ